MATSKVGVARAAATALVGMLACSNSDGNGSCVSAAVGSACYSCTQSNCGSQLNTFESSCSDYLSCVCSGGNFSCSAGTSSACQQKEQESSCVSAADAISNCVQQKCESACSSGDVQCEGDGSSAGATDCAGPAFDGGACANGLTTGFCTTTSGGATTCYYSVGSQQFACNSCSDTTSCAQAASAACQ